MSLAKPRPLVAATVAIVFAGGTLFAADWYASPSLVVPAISAVQVPKLDGDISDTAWKLSIPVEVLTRHGGDFGGSGESKVQVRAVHDDHYIYIALQWDDPTRSLEYMPLLKDSGGWHRLQTNANAADETRFVDDRVAILLAPSGTALIGGAIHLGSHPLADAPASSSGRGLHYTAPGKMLDLWVWHAALGPETELVQDGFLGPPLPFTQAQMAGDARYLGGIGDDDPDHAVARTNFKPPPGATDGTVLPLRLPRPDAATTNVDAIKLDPEDSDPLDQDSPWGLGVTDTVPYTSAANDRIPDGTVIPGVIVDDSLSAGPDDATARGTWAGGHWVLELRRSLKGGDKDLEIKSGMMMWFAVFDHSQTRHTYHLRPLIVEIQ